MSFVKIDFIINYGAAFLIFVLFSGLSLYVYKKINNANFIKPAYLGVLFIISIISSANYLFKDNELKINSVKPIAVFIEENTTENSQILVYNYLLPSLSFYLNQDITTINHGRYTTQRETQFETNEDWKKNLINYFDATDRTRILEMNPDNPTFLIKRKKDVFPDTLQIFANKLKHKKNFETFEVYY
jgi:4-amino-4-deoxy-L-arabinose transferase